MPLLQDAVNLFKRTCANTCMHNIVEITFADLKLQNLHLQTCSQAGCKRKTKCSALCRACLGSVGRQPFRYVPISNAEHVFPHHGTVPLSFAAVEGIHRATFFPFQGDPKTASAFVLRRVSASWTGLAGRAAGWRPVGGTPLPPLGAARRSASSRQSFRCGLLRSRAPEA